MWGSARSERLDVPGTDLIMALELTPAALGSRESGLSSGLCEADTEKGVTDARTSRGACPPGAPQPVKCRGKKGNG